ncbi:hypothetical protein [Polyangium sp. y55x31]|uniref:hypothetical protein n=1 Tax=Polyangium sp. y55x31 TaxID=3042688 RepID=UPI002482920E|nr:hypothetical protein [Polyangium sp. y55x31]MDI1480380.1 hypothetical protein [Polyangium sp. y55x31]
MLDDAALPQHLAVAPVCEGFEREAPVVLHARREADAPSRYPSGAASTSFGNAVVPMLRFRRVAFQPGVRCIVS